MPHRVQCDGKHRVLFIEEWSPLGAWVTCICGAEFHSSQTELEEQYLAFSHNSPAGPEFDIGIFVLGEEFD